jgi:predicted phage tail protein
MVGVSDTAVGGDRREQTFGVRHQATCARIALVLLLGGFVATVATIAAGTGFSATVAGGVLLMLPAFGALVLGGLACLPRRTRSADEQARRLGSTVALTAFGLLLFGCSWAVVVHNL